MEYKLVLERRVMLGLALLTVTCAVLVAVFNPDLVRFWPFTVTDFVQLVTPLFSVALFIERVLEVFLTSWRAESATKLKLKAQAAAKKRNGADPPTEDEERAGEYKNRTRRIAFFAGTAIGVIVAALGIRLLELFVDPAIFESLPRVQQKLFRTADVLLTGAVLGGGSDALHQLVSVFTNFMESAASRAKGN
jgi:hypothetical protein